MDLTGFFIILATILAGVGGALFFFGALFSVAIAFGKGRYVIGIVCILFLPLTVIYCLAHPAETKTANKYVYPGFAMVIAALTFALLIFKLQVN